MMSRLRALPAAPLSLMHTSFVRYLIVGGINTAVGLGVIYACMAIFGLNNVRSNLIGYTVGVLVSFVLNRSWTFAHGGAMLPALARFLAVLIVAYLANLATVVLLADEAGVDRFIAQAAGVPPYTLVGYLGSRFFAFRSGRRSEGGQACS
jgi:putative flippase GtrA